MKCRQLAAACAWACLVLALPHTAIAQDDFFGDISTKSNTTANDARFEFRGFYQQLIKYGLDEPDQRFAFERQRAGISMIRSDVFGEFEGRLSDSIDLRLSTKIEAETYRWSDNEHSWQSHNERVFLRDAFVDITLFKDHWLRAGHQIFSWGESESLAVLDVLSLRDQREFAQAQLQDLREQVPALQYSFPALSGKLGFITTYQAGHNRIADEDDEFYPYVRFKASGLRLRRQDVDNELEVAFKYDYQFNGGDLSIVVADVNNNDFSLQVSDDPSPEIVLSQERIAIAGLSLNRVFGPWLIKAELAQRFNQPIAYANSFYRTDQVRSALGLEYSGINDWFFSYEVNYAKHSQTAEEIGFSSVVEQPPSKPGHSAHVRYTALHDRLEQNLWYFKFIDDQGSIYRWEINYEYSDTIELGLTSIFYDVDNQDSIFFPFRAHDSVNFTITLHF